MPAAAPAVGGDPDNPTVLTEKRGGDMSNYRGFGRFGVSLGLTAALALTGCGNKLESYGSSPVNNDTCVTYRQPLIDTEKQYNDELAQDVAIGAVGGAVIGAIAGGGRGAAIGAAAGALTGAAASYYRNQQKKARNQAELQSLIDSDATNGNQAMGRLGNAVRNLSACRNRQVADTRAQYQNKQITRDQAKAQLNSINLAVGQDRQLIQEVLGKADERVNQLVQARAASNDQSEDAYLGNLKTYQGRRGPVAASSGGTGSTMYAQAGVNVRGEPSQNSARLGVLAPGSAILITGDSPDGAWYQVSYNGRTGYVIKSGLAGSPPAGGGTATAAASQPPPRTADATQSFYASSRDTRADATAEYNDVQNNVDSFRSVVEREG